MLLIRCVEEHICHVYATDVIQSPVHLSIGQESIAVGACDPLQEGDKVSATYRCHAAYIAKGGDLRQMMAELYGKSDGCAAGKAGSMHLIDMQHGVMGASAVVGTTIPVAAGYALALQRDARKTGKQHLMVAFLGDGATEEGVFSETLLFASLHRLPMILVCENNRLAIHAPLRKRWPSETFARDRAQACGIPVHYIPDGDVLAIRDTVADACSAVRGGNGPVFIECATYRWKEHVGVADDHAAGYRDTNEYARWQENDQIARLEKMLPEADVRRAKVQVQAMLDEAVAFAQSSPVPSADLLNARVYAA